MRLLETIEKECARIDKTVDVLLEVHVAQEESKSGFLPSVIAPLLQTDLTPEEGYVWLKDPWPWDEGGNA